MAIIKIIDLTFAYENSYDNIFENVSFQIDSNWKLGFVGRNGKGKTTFLRLLQGLYDYQGKIVSDLDFSYFPYQVSDDSMLTLHVIEDVDMNIEEWEIRRELNMLEVDLGVLYRPFNLLSKGEQTKVLLAILFLKHNNFLLIDEPTNHLDYKGRELLARYLNSKKGYILVSHDRKFVDSCVDHILAINKANIEVQSGNYSSWWKNKQDSDNLEIMRNEKLKSEIKRLEVSSREKAVWSDRVEATKIGFGPCDRGYIGHKAAKMMKRSKNIEQRYNKAIEEKKGLLKNIDEMESLKISFLPFVKKDVLVLNELSIKYNDRRIMEPISFSLEQGDRIHLKGINGCGKSSVIKLIMGETIEYDGYFHKSDSLIISYVSQDTSMLAGSVDSYIQNNNLDGSLFMAILRKLGFDRVQFEKMIDEYSDGQKKKVLLAKSLCEKAHVYIFDEPLNYVDVISRIQIEDLILEYQPTMIFVEHDQVFSEKIATKVIEIKGL